MNTTIDTETAVRSYLTSLTNPDSLVDADAVATLEASASSVTDPIDKIRALAALRKARTPDASSLERGFVQHARAWAEANDIPIDIFEEMGVPVEILRSAGLLKGRKPAARPGTRNRTVTAGEIKRAVLADKAKVFTLADLSSSVGGSPMTVRKAMDELVAAGEVVRLGPTPNWSGRGRAPIQFSKV